MLHKKYSRNLSARDQLERLKEKHICGYLESLALAKKSSKNILLGKDNRNTTRIKQVSNYDIYRQITKPKHETLFCGRSHKTLSGVNIYKEFFENGKLSDLDLDALQCINDNDLFDDVFIGDTFEETTNFGTSGVVQTATGGYKYIKSGLYG